jgi:hypothetical protein
VDDALSSMSDPRHGQWWRRIGDSRLETDPKSAQAAAYIARDNGEQSSILRIVHHTLTYLVFNSGIILTFLHDETHD